MLGGEHLAVEPVHHADQDEAHLFRIEPASVELTVREAHADPCLGIDCAIGCEIRGDRIAQRPVLRVSSELRRARRPFADDHRTGVETVRFEARQDVSDGHHGGRFCDGARARGTGVLGAASARAGVEGTVVAGARLRLRGHGFACRRERARGNDTVNAEPRHHGIVRRPGAPAPP